LWKTFTKIFVETLSKIFVKISSWNWNLCEKPKVIASHVVWWIIKKKKQLHKPRRKLKIITVRFTKDFMKSLLCDLISISIIFTMWWIFKFNKKKHFEFNFKSSIKLQAIKLWFSICFVQTSLSVNNDNLNTHCWIIFCVEKNKLK
jgi:hypothetical protein